MPCRFKGYDPNFAKTSALSLQTSVLARSNASSMPPAEDEPAEDSPEQGAARLAKMRAQNRGLLSKAAMKDASKPAQPEQPAQVPMDSPEPPPMDSPEFDAMVRRAVEQDLSNRAASRPTPLPSGSEGSKPTR
ncbi:MAG: hypothetical protein KGZ52_02955 [Xanthomonadaceae bacterium]|jgi:hypothetical protein|nr:hypothetical protein [Xanthomonadaceae bacterium]